MAGNELTIKELTNGSRPGTQSVRALSNCAPSLLRRVTGRGAQIFSQRNRGKQHGWEYADDQLDG
jgi:hypothetical protein